MQLQQQKHLSLKQKVPPRKHPLYRDHNEGQQQLQKQKLERN